MVRKELQNDVILTLTAHVHICIMDEFSVYLDTNYERSAIKTYCSALRKADLLRLATDAYTICNVAETINYYVVNSTHGDLYRALMVILRFKKSRIVI